MAKKILIGNYKGGVGKTTSVINIGAILSSNAKVLLIDLDPQSSLSEICIPKHRDEDIEQISSLDVVNYLKYGKYFLNDAYKFYLDMEKAGVPNIQYTIQPIKLSDKLHIIPNSLYYYVNNPINNIGLDDLSMIMGDIQQYLFVLPNILHSIDCENQYDFVIFDTPPSSNIITQSAFLLSDYLLVPTIMDDISIKGVEHYSHKVKSIYNRYCRDNKASEYFISVFGDEIKFIGLFETMRRGNNCQIENAFRTQIRTNNNMHLFDTIIKDISDVVYDTLSISSILNPMLNVGEGVGRDDCKRGYKELCEEIIKYL